MSYGGTRRGISLTLLVAANLLPIAGVVFLDWDVAAIVVLYWSENLVIGAYNLAKMLSLGGIGAVLTSLFFLIHYGGFCAVHGLFILILLLEQQGEVLGNTSWPFVFVFLELLVNVISEVLAQAPPAWIIGLIGLVISHGYSFVANFLLSPEREQATVQSLMSAPYKRIVLLHVAIILGGMAVVTLGQPLALLIALVLLKIAMDIGLHLRSHRTAGD